MKRTLVFSIITVLLFTNVASSEITWSGDVDPSDPSTWDSSTYGYIGITGYGTMDITNGSDVIDRYGFIGDESDGTGVVTVDGYDSTWINGEYLTVGMLGKGSLNITNGGEVSNGSGRIGEALGGTGIVTIDGYGSTWTNNGDLDVGHWGSGILNIIGGGEVISRWSNIGETGRSTGGVVTVDGYGSTWNNDGFTVGYYGKGTLNITNGGTVNNSYGRIGEGSSGTGEVTVDGSGSTWTNSGELYVGKYGNGRLNITGGGEVSNGFGGIGYWSGSGEVTVDGSGSTWMAYGNLYIGLNGQGTLNITNGGLVSVAGTLIIDSNGDDDSFINMGTDGKLAVLGDGADSLIDFLGLIEGTDAIRCWDDSIMDWADITDAIYGIDYTLEYLTIGDLAGYTMLTVPGPATVEVSIDIKPQACPNLSNVKSKGMLPVAILGSEVFDVNGIDIASIQLNGIQPIRSSFEDVSTPLSEPNECECTTNGPDGFIDLTLKFDTQQIVESLGEVNTDDVIPLPLTGVLYDETPIEGQDCIVIKGRHKPKNIADVNNDGVVNSIDMALLAENWLESSIIED